MEATYNFYGKGEYTVQYMGDDIFFATREEAERFIKKQEK